MFTYLQNLIRLRRGDFTLAPRLAVYYVTMQCNLNCTYCEDFGSRRNHQVTPAPPLEDAKKILKVIRTGVDRLWLTGGEPLMYPEILELLAYARNDLKFREISLITNGTLLSDVVARSGARASNGECATTTAKRACGKQSPDESAPRTRRLLRAEERRPRNDIFALVDRLIISLDAIDPQSLNAVSVPETYTETVITNVRAAASLQKAHNFKLILNAVITPETLPNMESLLAFCTENNAEISFSPQSVNNLPRYELVTSPEYRAFIEKIIRLRKQGAPILGSTSYLKILLDQTPYECYPTLVPRILPDGWLTYPCRPMEKADGEQGGRAVNLLEVQTWKEAWKIATEIYGAAPTSCVSCFQQCYAEPSLMQARPFEYLAERLRGNDVSAYSPG
jgi:MoaA/NifB/PqqE/SkfB family radical SAM enzyme